MEPDYVKLREIKPVLSGYIREALTLVDSKPHPDEKTVHDIRVLMKKSRAVMRLIGSQLYKESYTRNFGAFKDVGRLMNFSREASVHRKTVKQLKKIYPGVFNGLDTDERIMRILQKENPVIVDDPDAGRSLSEINQLLTKAGYRIRFESLNNLDPGLLLKELNKTYKSAAKKYLICRNKHKPELIHEFRKRAKDFLYQLYFFRPLNPSVVKSVEKKLDSMTQNLGKYNDLTQLIGILDYKYSGTESNSAMDELIITIRDEQDRYLSKVWPVAHKLLKPGLPLVNLLGFKLLLI